MEGTSLASATIIDKDHGSTVKCMFNPKEYTFSKQNSWKANDTKGTNLGQVEFSSGQPTTLQMQLFFDTYANVKNDAIGGVPKDVRKVYTGAIWKMMKVDKSLADAKNKKGRPPIVIFQWGSTWTFKAAITSVRERFTLFTAEGGPGRSTLDVTCQQIQDENDFPGKNPPTAGMGGQRRRQVHGGANVR